MKNAKTHSQTAKTLRKLRIANSLFEPWTRHENNSNNHEGKDNEIANKKGVSQ